jgi:hypothetical protein
MCILRRRKERSRERFVLPLGFAKDATEAHARLLTLLVTEPYFELPQHGFAWPIPLNSKTVRRVVVWVDHLPGLGAR